MPAADDGSFRPHSVRPAAALHLGAPAVTVADEHLRAHLKDITQSYLNPHGFILRAIIYFAIWNLLAFLLSKWSAEGDQPGARDNAARFSALSGRD